jgi:hypothetical protein
MQEADRGGGGENSTSVSVQSSELGPPIPSPKRVPPTWVLGLETQFIRLDRNSKRREEKYLFLPYQGVVAYVETYFTMCGQNTALLINYVNLR